MTKMSEIISRTTKEETEKLCIEQNPVRDEVRSVPGIGETSLGRPRNKFGIKKDRRLSARSTIRRNLEKHGVKNASALPEVRAKTEKTAMERHGVRASSQSPETKEKQKRTNPRKHGAGSRKYVWEPEAPDADEEKGKEGRQDA